MEAEPVAAQVVPMDHVSDGPLARTSEHGEPDPVTGLVARRAREPMWFGTRARSWMTILVAVFAITAIGLLLPALSHAFVYAISATVLSTVALHRVWRREHVA
jgi:hypothetical protein